ncbi:hypothetical protein An04g05040 [Aspergillus niger]|uniref:Uncharacterized protein n=2 Tax=Aspergillus niger TaxID=5061 RepID=A2QIX2_ASPNC|nr:hypothetical protein An04g05040 [Aspergillus niger]CAK38766.1 hypothetical protein An04g05040 [Aspergillus niger]
MGYHVYLLSCLPWKVRRETLGIKLRYPSTRPGLSGSRCRFDVLEGRGGGNRQCGRLELATPGQSYPRPKVSHPTEPSSGQDGLGEEGNTDPHPVRLCLRTLKVNDDAGGDSSPPYNILDKNHDWRQLNGAPKESELRRITAGSRQYNKQCLRMRYPVRP